MNYTIFLPVLIAFGLSVMMGPVIIPIPVSYTHLDVYKRQRLSP